MFLQVVPGSGSGPQCMHVSPMRIRTQFARAWGSGPGKFARVAFFLSGVFPASRGRNIFTFPKIGPLSFIPLSVFPLSAHVGSIRLFPSRAKASSQSGSSGCAKSTKCRGFFR